MPRRVAVTNLNASTIDILNVIRQNASLQYQNTVPEVKQANDIPKVGEVLYGYPALANEFINALINRIAMVKIKSANFNNMYADLKKGYLEFGETVEEVFIQITKAREFSVEKAEDREFKRSLPDVRTAFHTLNYKSQYPLTIQDEDLRMAFMSMDGIQDMIARFVGSVYTANQYDEFLLFKYLLIKSISKGKMYPEPVYLGSNYEQPSGTTSLTSNAGPAVKFRAMSNKLRFMSNKYNAEGVTTNTPIEDQYIFMDAELNARYDVGVLAGAFNMEKADFIGHLKLIDDWTTFDNDRFSQLIENTDGMELVTEEELAIMKDVVAVLVDKEFFQIYDNLDKMTEKYVASGMYWNYFYNVWKTVSYSPFSNAVVFIKTNNNDTYNNFARVPETFTAKISDLTETNVTRGESGYTGVKTSSTVVFTVTPDETDSVKISNVEFVQDVGATSMGIAVQRYGAYIMGKEGITNFNDNGRTLNLSAKISDTLYSSSVTWADFKTGTTLTFNKETE